VAPKFALWAVLIAGTLFAGDLPGVPRAPDAAGADNSAPVRKGKDFVMIVAHAVTMSQDAVIEGEDGSAYILLLRIDKVLKGKIQDRYVRADFANHVAGSGNPSAKLDPAKTQTYREFMSSMRQGKPWKIRLRPPTWISECRFTIPKAPSAREEVGFLTPVMVPIGNAKGYPDINALTCYAFEFRDIEKVDASDVAR
jgi:hypothetical protein